MRVCLLGTENDFKTSTGQGVHRYMYELSHNLPRINARGVEIKTSRYKEFPLMYNGFTPLVHSIVDDFSKYDIVHSLDARPLSFIRYGKAISINTAHDFHSVVVPELNPEDYENIRRVLGLYMVLLPGIRTTLKSDYIIANSTQTRDEAVSFGFDRRRIFVSSHGVDSRFIHQRKISIRNNGNFKVGYIGSLSTTKNVAFSIRAFMKTENKNSVFEIWGNKYGQYEELFRISKPDRRIMFKGFAPESKLIETYDSFDVFVHPTLYEGFGLPILEAQARGLPVLIYKKAMIPEEVKRYCIETKSEEHMAQEIETLRMNGYNESLCSCTLP